MGFYEWQDNTLVLDPGYFAFDHPVLAINKQKAQIGQLGQGYTGTVGEISMNNVLLGLGGLAGGYFIAKIFLGGENGMNKNPNRNFRKVHTHIDDWHPHGSKSQVRNEYKQIVDYAKSAPSHANWYAAMEAGTKAVEYTGDYKAMKPELSRVAKMLGKEIPYNSPKPREAILALRQYMPVSKSALMRRPVRNRKHR
jgi:hypothetical protein